MITRASIRSLCNSASYTRGLEIYRNEDKLLEFQVENTEKEALVKATVKGSGSKCYRVKLKYDKEKDFLDSMWIIVPEKRRLQIMRLGLELKKEHPLGEETILCSIQKKQYLMRGQKRRKGLWHNGF